MHICYLSDGKAGHQAQVMGLVSALSALEQVSLTTLTVSGAWPARWQTAHTPLAHPPDIIIGAGHRTHLPVWLMGRRYPKAKTVIVMKPSLPLSWFDFVIMPQHDWRTGSVPSNVLLTQGVMNRFVDAHCHKSDHVLVLIGGTNQRFGFDSQRVVQQVTQLCQQYQALGVAHIVITDSRRTPSRFRELLKNSLSKKINPHDVATTAIRYFPVEDTQGEWLNRQYQTAKHVWVTSDSVNMIYEALSAGCQVGLIDLPTQKIDRVTKMVEQLRQAGTVTTLSDFCQGQSLPAGVPLNEAKRAAQWLLAQVSTHTSTEH